MAPKNNKGGDKSKAAKGKATSTGDDAGAKGKGGKGGLKAATAINVRHILVRFCFFSWFLSTPNLLLE